jgi:tetratricopeptide (TPR) repeat protein
MLDPAYANTAIRVADLTYADGRYSEALPLYAAIIQKDPHALDSQISTIVDELAGSPALLKQLRAAYLATPYQNDRLLLSILGLISSRERNYPEAISAFGQLVAIQPDSIEALQNYTIVLSNGLEYQNASIQAQNLVALAAAQQLPAETIALYQQLADYLVAKIP